MNTTAVEEQKRILKANSYLIKIPSESSVFDFYLHPSGRNLITQLHLSTGKVGKTWGCFTTRRLTGRQFAASAILSEVERLFVRLSSIIINGSISHFLYTVHSLCLFFFWIVSLVLSIYRHFYVLEKFALCLWYAACFSWPLDSNCPLCQFSVIITIVRWNENYSKGHIVSLFNR